MKDIFAVKEMVPSEFLINHMLIRGEKSRELGATGTG